eukprot:COSAG01_NODE_1_length_100484_cov_170.446142_16_plen_123_part_00
MAKDSIFIKDLLVRGVIGIYDWERKVQQDILINAEMSFDTQKAGSSDDMNDSLNYKSVCKRIIAFVEVNQPYLIEKLINDLAKTLILEFKIEKIILSIEKPGALRFAKSVGIRIERRLNDYA